MCVIGRADLLLTALRIPEQEFHVALPAGDPDLSEVHVLKTRIADRQNGVLHGRLLRKCEREFPFGHLGGQNGFSVQGNGYGLFPITDAPDGNRSASLQDQAVAEYTCKLYHWIIPPYQS